MQPDKPGPAKALWRWLKQPVISVADGLAIATLTITADAMKLTWHLPWGIVLVIAWTITAAAMFGTGFVKGFTRSALADYRRWRTTRH